MLEMDFIRDFRSHLESPFEHTLFIAGLRNYCSVGNPLRFNNFSFAMRELVTNILNRKASAENVMAAPWYVRLDEKRNVNRKQQLKYCAQKHIPDRLLSQNALDRIESKITEYNKEFNFFNKYTHITEKYFNSKADTFFKEARELILLTSRAYDHFEDLEEIISNDVLDQIEEEINKSVLENIPDEVDILSSSTIIDESEVYNIRLITIDNEYLYFLVEGKICITRQYGKGDDFLSQGDSYPFLTTIKIKNSDFRVIEHLNINIAVDTSEWYANSPEDAIYQSYLFKANYLTRISHIGITPRIRERLFPGINYFECDCPTIENISYVIPEGEYLEFLDNDIPF